MGWQARYCDNWLQIKEKLVWHYHRLILNFHGDLDYYFVVLERVLGELIRVSFIQ